MYEFMKLELRKNRFLFWGFVGSFIFGELFVFGMGVVTHDSALQMAVVAAMFSAVAGPIFMPLIYGAASGANMRNEPAVSAEAGLPISPGKKMAGALAAMFFYFVCLSAIHTLTALLLSPWILEGKISLPDGGLLWHFGLTPLLVLLAAFILMLISFTCAYAVRNTMVGGLIALLLGAALAAGLVLGAMARLAQGVAEPLRAILPGLIIIPLLALAGTLFALGKLARWGERRVMPGIIGWVLIGLGLGAGALSAAGWLAKGYSDLSRQFLLPTAGWHFVNHDPGSGFLPGVRQAAARHTLLATRSGGLVSVDGAGKRVQLLPEDPRNPVELMRHPWLIRIRSYAWDVDGSVWVLLQTEMPEDNGQFELWRGSPDAPLKSHSFFKAPTGLHPYRLAHRGDTLGIIAATDASNVPDQFAPLPPPAKAPVFAPAGEGVKDQRQRDDYLLAHWFESGHLARVSDDGKTLSRRTPGGGTQSWTFPEGAIAMHGWTVRRRLIETGGDQFFLIAVSLPDESKATAVCSLNGAVRLEWRGITAPQEGRLDEAGYLRVNYQKHAAATSIFMLTGDGRFLPPLLVDAAKLSEWQGHAAGPAERRADPVWLNGTRLFLRIGFRHLAEIDGETGKLLKLWNPPEFDTLGIHQIGEMSSGRGVVSDAGFHYIAAGRLYHAGFDGVTKDLGRAMAD